MKMLIILVTAMFCFSVNAEEKKNLSDYQTIDMKQFEGLDQKPKSNIQFSINCKTEDGRELKSTDVGYNECLEQAKNKSKK